GYTVARQRTGELMLIPVGWTARVRLIRLTWEFAAGGPLGWLADARPACSTSLRDFIPARRALVSGSHGWSAG
ncbi:MAG: hypothetical protein ACRDTE_34035, partial [Pseudonocardiaceae bacterium]